ncbi:MAG: (2Fe-2S)-binding protein [Pseudomonadales bacterium]|jgi:bacterioferritin-associated ferredoxin
MYVCLCKAVTDSEIREAVEDGAVHLSHLAERWGLGTGCGCCRETAQQLIDEHLAGELGVAAA